MSEFKLWLEFEEVDPGTWDKNNDFANIHVELSDGRKYGINVWTYKFFETAINDDIKNNKNTFIIPPDLFVQELTRECIHATIQKLLNLGDLETVLNPGVLIESLA